MNTDEIEQKLLEAERELSDIDRKRGEILSLISNLKNRLQQQAQSGQHLSQCKDQINKYSPESEKISLFMSLFRGRTDVFPRRFESKSGKSGYQPACKNEWVPSVCNKPKIKCGSCDNRSFIPLSRQIIMHHLLGFDPSDRNRRNFVAGIYPLLPGDTCCFLAADFDKAEWEKDSSAFINTCRTLNVPAYIERSRSGKGAHVWIFFSEEVPASLARRLGAFILTAAMESRPGIGFDSYDRFFPNQDFMPKGGFGNLIALPLQKKARAAGNSEFLDNSLIPYEDQWAFLASVKKMSASDIYAVDGFQLSEDFRDVHGFTEEEIGKPWDRTAKADASSVIAAKMPECVNLVISDQLYIDKNGLPPAAIHRLIRIASFRNPEFYKAQSMRLPTFDKPRFICCYDDYPKYLALPRGCLNNVSDFFKANNTDVKADDRQYSGIPVKAGFCGTLKPEQEAAAAEILKYCNGILAASTAFGKTVTALYIIASRKVNTLILVHRQQLLEQWIERISSFLQFPKNEIGYIKGGQRKLTGIIDVALLQSAYKKGEVDEFVSDYGQVIVDECHHISSFSFEKVIRRCRAKYLLGLSATVERKDGQHPVIFMNLGPVRYRTDAKRQAAESGIIHRVFARATEFIPPPVASDSYSAVSSIYSALACDKERNRMITNDIIEAVRKGKSPLVLTERKEHLNELYVLLSGIVPNVIIFSGGMGKKARRTEEEKLQAAGVSGPRVIIATGRYIGEGFDDARLDTLFLTMPVSWKGVIAQYAGRLHREHYGKNEVVIYDYVDVRSPLLLKMFRRRIKGYSAIGYSVENADMLR